MALVILVTEKGKRKIFLSLCRYSTTGNTTMNWRQAIKNKGQVHCILTLVPGCVNTLSLVRNKMQEKYWFHLQHSRHNTGRGQEKGISSKRVCGAFPTPKKARFSKLEELSLWVPQPLLAISCCHNKGNFKLFGTFKIFSTWNWLTSIQAFSLLALNYFL